MKKGFIIPLIIIAVVTVAGLIGLGFYFSKKGSVPTTTNPIVTQAQPSPILTQTFQQILKNNCQKIDHGAGSFSFGIDLDKAPIKIDPKILTVVFQTNNSLPCTFFDESKNSNWISVPLSDRKEITVYDINSKDLGHGGPSYIGALTYVIKDDGNFRVSITLAVGEGPPLVHQIPLLMRGEKVLKLTNGETIYASYTQTAIDANDDRLIKLLNKYSESSQNFPGEKELTGDPIVEIKSTFFSNLSNLQSTEKAALIEIE
ncbi:MAG: hypothetical protein ACHQVK_01150, partial [Candidatus Paceibacterales bacterium]